MKSELNFLDSQPLSLGNRLQNTAIRWNNSTKHPVIGFIGARVIMVLAGPSARVLDTAIHVILGVGKILVGATVTAPLSFCVYLVRGKGLDTQWRVSKGLSHIAYSVFFAADIFICIPINLISPNLYPAKKTDDLRQKILSAKSSHNQVQLDIDDSNAALKQQETITDSKKAAQTQIQTLQDDNKTLEEEHDLAKEAIKLQQERKKRVPKELDRKKALHEVEVRISAITSKLQSQTRAKEEKKIAFQLQNIRIAILQHEIATLRLQLAEKASNEPKPEVLLPIDAKADSPLEAPSLPPSPPPPPPPPPQPSKPQPFKGADESSSNPKVSSPPQVNRLTPEALVKKAENLSLKMKPYLWPTSKTLDLNNPNFQIWAKEEFKNILTADAYLKTLWIKLSCIKTRPARDDDDMETLFKDAKAELIVFDKTDIDVIETHISSLEEDVDAKHTYWQEIRGEAKDRIIQSNDSPPRKNSSNSISVSEQQKAGMATVINALTEKGHKTSSNLRDFLKFTEDVLKMKEEQLDASINYLVPRLEQLSQAKIADRDRTKEDIEAADRQTREIEELRLSQMKKLAEKTKKAQHWIRETIYKSLGKVAKGNFEKKFPKSSSSSVPLAKQLFGFNIQDHEIAYILTKMTKTQVAAAVTAIESAADFADNKWYFEEIQDLFAIEVNASNSTV